MNSDHENTIEFLQVGYSVPGGRSLLCDLNLQIRKSESLVLLGRSGSGKTTSLKMINRILTPTSGEVRVNGRKTTEWNPIQLRRGIGYAVQDVGLFPHYTVAENVGLIPRAEGWDKQRIRSRTEEMLSLVRLPFETYAKRYPQELSGGQRQRVGLARALAAGPKILLMDEPFGALDPLTRAELQREFVALRMRLGTTVVFVTHDVGEALLVGDHIALIEDGKSAGVYTSEEFRNSRDERIRAYRESMQPEANR